MSDGPVEERIATSLAAIADALRLPLLQVEASAERDFAGRSERYVRLSTEIRAIEKRLGVEE